MINIQRTTEIPASLQKPAIQKYLNDLEDYKDGVLKDKPQKPITYRNSDVLKAFDKCFFSKCYLTEEKFQNSFVMDIDHFIPKNEKPELTYEWTNLFPADHHANMARPRTTPKGGYLNPCDKNDDVEQDIIYSVGMYGTKPNFKPTSKTNLKAVNTIELLQKLHLGSSTEASIEKSKELQRKIKIRYDELTREILKWQRAKIEKDKQKEFNAENNLKELLSRRASFTMLMRSSDIVIENKLTFLFD